MRFIVIAAAFALSACATSAPPAPPSLKVVGDRLFIDASVNGHETEALLDSAAEISFLDAAWAKEIGLETAGAETAKGTGGSTDVTFAEGVTVETLGVTLENLTVAVLDLSDISNRLIGRPVHFVTGRELFDQQRLAIDIDGGTIAPVDRSETPRGVEAPLTTLKGLETLKVRVNGVEADADFDLGNGSGVLIGKAFAEQLGLLADRSTLETRKGGGIGGELERVIVHLDTLEVGGETFKDVEAAVDETETAGAMNVGVGLMRNFRITTDFSESKIWLAPR